MNNQESINFFKAMFVNMLDLASHAVRGSETQESSHNCMRHLEVAIKVLTDQPELLEENKDLKADKAIGNKPIALRIVSSC